MLKCQKVVEWPNQRLKIDELDRKYPTQEVMNAISIIYPQYWLSN
jgi:hypothetical protein